MLSYPAVARGELWRLVTNQFIFTQPAEMLFGLVLLYHLRMIERQAGTRKYAMLALLSNAVTNLLNLLYLSTLSSTSVHSNLVSGPYGLIYSSLVLYALWVPEQSSFTVMNLRLSNKFFAYAMGLQMCFSTNYSALSAIFGLIAGVLYSSEPLKLQSIAMPEAVANTFNKIAKPLLYVAPNPRPQPQQAQQAGVRRHPLDIGNQNYHERLFGGQERRPVADPPTRTVQPREEDIQALLGLGFDRDDVVRALIRSNNNLLVASNSLLDTTR